MREPYRPRGASKSSACWRTCVVNLDVLLLGSVFGNPHGRENEQENTMSENKDTGPEAAVKGIVEDVKGKAKEAAGAIAGKDELRREGRAQQDKAGAERDVAAKEAEAEKARAEAEAHEAEQRSHQS